MTDPSNNDHTEDCQIFFLAVAYGDIGRDNGDYVIGTTQVAYCPFCGKKVEGYNV